MGTDGSQRLAFLMTSRKSWGKQVPEDIWRLAFQNPTKRVQKMEKSYCSSGI
jgi:hypothetical protein